MLDKNNILKYIKSSNLIETKLKNNLLNHFHKLSHKQIENLVKYFNEQKYEILKMLIILKDKKICSFEEIKTKLDKLNRDMIKKQEFEDEKQDEKLFNLLNEI